MLKHLLTVEDTFEIEGRGTLLAPLLPPERFKRAFSAPSDLRRPDGQTLRVQARIVGEHLPQEAGGGLFAWTCPKSRFPQALKSG